MNLEICKKCLGTKHVKFFCNNVYNVSLHKDFYYVGIVGYPLDVCKLKHHKMFDNIGEVEEIIHTDRAKEFIVMDESCPFYIEQKVDELNK